MPEENRTIQVTMLRETLGEKRDDAGQLEKLKEEKTYTVSLNFGRWLIFKQKAVAASAKDAKAATKTGPVKAEDIPTANKK